MSPEEMLAEQLRLLTEQNAWLRWYVIATAAIMVATVLQEWFRALLGRVSLDVEGGAIVTTPMGDPEVTRAHFVRLRVFNRSRWRAARYVEMVLEEASRKTHASGEYVSGGDINGLNLWWSHVGTALIPQIAAGTVRTADLGHVVRPSDRPSFPSNAVENKPTADPARTIFKLGAAADPFHRNHLLEPGEWKVVLRLSGANVRPRRVEVKMRVVGTWHDDPADFARDDFSYQVG